MTRLLISTRGPLSWRERLASPEHHWRRRYSAFETAISWESAAKNRSGLPEPVSNLFAAAGYQNPELLLGVAEHKVDLPGGRAASQSDVWALVKSDNRIVSLTVEAKANEPFGDSDLDSWLRGNAKAHEEEASEASKTNRAARWEYIRKHLPNSNLYGRIRYQLLHRCAAAVIEADRFGLQHAAFVVQAFGTPDDKFADYKLFCETMGLTAARGGVDRTSVDGIVLNVGWADCPFAKDDEIADAVSG